MRISRERLIEEYAPVFFDFHVDESLEFVYQNESFELTDEAHLIRLFELSSAGRDYEICKIANNMLAVLETKHQFIEYRHLPVILHMELSDFCNCECIMCKHCYEKNQNAHFLPDDTLRSLGRYFAVCKIVIINGYGEPFIHPRILDFLSLFEEYKVKVFTTTNLQRIPLDHLAQINRVFQRINVSCDGACAATYESIRRGASFDTFIQNVKRVRAECPDVELFLSVVAMRQNIEEAAQIVRFAKELGFEEVRFGRLGSNLFLGNEKDELIYYPNYAGMLLEQARAEGGRIGIRVVTPIIHQNNVIDDEKAAVEKEELHRIPFYKEEAYYAELSEQFLEMKKHHRFEQNLYSTERAISCSGLCHWIGFGMYINSSGKVRPCSEIPFHREQEKRTETIDYNYGELKEFRKQFIAGGVPRVCMDCAFIMSDEIGCLKVDLEEYKNYFIEKAKNACVEE